MTPSELNDRLPKGAKARVAKRANVSRSTVTKVCKGERTSRRLWGLLAQEARIPLSEFPLSNDGGNL